MTTYGGDVVCLWGGDNTNGPVWTPSSNEYDVLALNMDGVVGMNPNVVSNVASNYTNSWCNCRNNGLDVFEFMDGYGGQSGDASEMDQMCGNMEVLGTQSLWQCSPRSSTPTQDHMWSYATDYSTTVANECVLYPPVDDTDTIFKQMYTEPTHLAVARQSLKDKKTVKKEAKLLLGLATVGICKASRLDPNRSVKNAESAKKYRSDKDDRMAFLVQANARLEFDNTVLLMEIAAYNINGAVPKYNLV
jgi:hypothetical protein